jgi:hypothetical protein
MEIINLNKEKMRINRKIRLKAIQRIINNYKSWIGVEWVRLSYGVTETVEPYWEDYHKQLLYWERRKIKLQHEN